MTSFKKSGFGEMRQSASSLLKGIGKLLCDRSLYALGISSDILLTPDDTLFISVDGYGDSEVLRTKAVLHHEACISPAPISNFSFRFFDTELSKK